MPNAHAAVILMRLVLAWANPLLNRILRQLLRPATPTALFGAVTDLTRSKADLIAENALLRHQLTLLKRQSKRPKLKPADRLSLLLLARVVRTWRQALLIVQPATLLRTPSEGHSWHREGYRLFWKWKSRRRNSQPRISAETIALVRRMWVENPLWGAERIRGELLKLGIEVAKRTIQRYLGEKSRPRLPSQTWSRFLKTHATDIWACDFIPVLDVLCRQFYIWVVVELESRRVIHFGVTRHPGQFWTAQQLREATVDGRRPRYMIRDNDNKYGSAFDIVAEAAGIEVIRTPIRAPLANAICERFVGTVRRECLDHMLIFGERQLYRVIAAYIAYFNRSRPHQGIGQNVPCGPPPWFGERASGKIISLPVLNGLHHEYRRAA